MKIYTRTGDSGQTGLFGGERVSKADPRVEAYGAVDELNSLLGLVRAKLAAGALSELLADVQGRLFDVGAELATPRVEDPKLAARVPRISASSVQALEGWIDRLEADLPPLRSFVLPGGSEAGALLHVARAVCRRAERRVVALAERAAVNPEILRYLNRLGDLLFVAARWVNLAAGTPEAPWRAVAPAAEGEPAP
ncbi:MAG: cob(I)yrinic acid a,c-diamide adenosyltransferase [bacterium]